MVWMHRSALPELVPLEVLHDCTCCLLPQTMAMVESIWPSEQLAMALTTPVDPSNLDPADPQVGHCPPLADESLIHREKEANNKPVVILVAMHNRNPV